MRIGTKKAMTGLGKTWLTRDSPPDGSVLFGRVRRVAEHLSGGGLGLLVLLLEHVPDAAEVRGGLPAGPHLAGPRHPVTLAPHLPVPPHHLGRGRV